LPRSSPHCHPMEGGMAMGEGAWDALADERLQGLREARVGVLRALGGVRLKT